MSKTPVSGRHRAAGRHNPLTELTGMVARAGESGVKASAVLAASGGMVAAFALPAQAAPATAQATTISAPVAVKAAPAAVKAAPAVVAPDAAAPAKVAQVGVVGVSAVEKPPPPPVVVAPVEQPQQTSRSATRSATRTSTAAAAATSSAQRQAASGSIVDIARSLLGIYYVYGGTTPAGFDCSGFTQYVYAHAGISIPRTATAQMNAATIVSNPQPGDLVFTVSGGIATHVGIYTGPGMMIDSPRTGKATSERAIFSGNVYGRF